MRIEILDTTLRSRFYDYYQQNNQLPDLYFTVKFNEITYYTGLHSNKQIYGSTAKYSFVVPRAFANYPVSTVEVYELDNNGNIAVSPSIVLNYDDEYIYDGIDQIIEFELILQDTGDYVSAIDMFLLTHIAQSIYLSDDIVVQMLKNNDVDSGKLYLKIQNPKVESSGKFSYENGLMIKGNLKDYAYIYHYQTGEIYIL